MLNRCLQIKADRALQDPQLASKVTQSSDPEAYVRAVRAVSSLHCQYLVC